MSRSKYKEKILEKMRELNAELRLLSEILKQCEEEEKNGCTSTSNG